MVAKPDKEVLMNIKNGQEGLSLVELMSVVGIISILGTIGIQSMFGFIVSARRAEAKVNLDHLYGLQMTYHEANGQYYLNTISRAVTGTNVTGQDTCNNATAGGIALGFTVSDCRRSN